MKIAIFGGSFDPPHMGHAMVIQWILLTGQADEVWLLPTFAHALKDRNLSPWEDRCDWCNRLAEVIDPGAVAVCTIEETLPQPSYTIRTLEALDDLYPEHEFRLVIGSDILSSELQAALEAPGVSEHQQHHHPQASPQEREGRARPSCPEGGVGRAPHICRLLDEAASVGLFRRGSRRWG